MLLWTRRSDVSQTEWLRSTGCPTSDCKPVFGSMFSHASPSRPSGPVASCAPCNDPGPTQTPPSPSPTCARHLPPQTTTWTHPPDENAGTQVCPCRPASAVCRFLRNFRGTPRRIVQARAQRPRRAPPPGHTHARLATRARSAPSAQAATGRPPGSRPPPAHRPPLLVQARVAPRGDAEGGRERCAAVSLHAGPLEHRPPVGHGAPALAAARRASLRDAPAPSGRRPVRPRPVRHREVPRRHAAPTSSVRSVVSPLAARRAA